MRKIVTNDSCSVEEVRSRTTAVADPKRLTWGEVGACAKGVLLHPGFVYHNAAKGRAGLRRYDITNANLYESDDFADFLGHVVGVPAFATVGMMIAPNSVLLGTLFAVGGLGIGWVVAPRMANNGLHFMGGAVLDAETLFRKAKGITLVSNARERLERIKRTPVHETLRLRK